MTNPIYERIKSQHPDWSEDQIWTAVSLELQSEAVIDKKGPIDPEEEESIIEEIIRGAEGWLESVLPQVFDRVRVFFDDLLDNLAAWIQKGIQKGIEYILQFLNNYF